MRFRQWVDAGGSLSYALIDEATGIAALVDPVASLEAAYVELAHEHRLRIAYVLHTRITADSGGIAATSDRYADLAASLGLRIAPDQALAAHRDALWERLGCPRIGPRSSWIPDESNAGGAPTLVQVDRSLFEIRARTAIAQGMEWFVTDAGGAFASPIRIAYDGIRVLLGNEIIDGIACPRSPGALVYRWRDRLFNGGSVAGVVRARVPQWASTLPDETLVYPGRVEAGLRVASLGQITTLDQPAVDAPAPLPDGTPHPGGFREIDPDAARAALSRLVVIDISDPRAATHRIPGACSIRTQEIPKVAGDWPRDRPILVVSETGMRCETASRMLQHMGFTWVYRLIGGLELWRESDLPLQPILSQRSA